MNFYNLSPFDKAQLGDFRIEVTLLPTQSSQRLMFDDHQVLQPGGGISDSFYSDFRQPESKLLTSGVHMDNGNLDSLFNKGITNAGKAAFNALSHGCNFVLDCWDLLVVAVTRGDFNNVPHTEFVNKVNSFGKYSLILVFF